jgi:carbamoyl-phosphate synthase small subunit
MPAAIALEGTDPETLKRPLARRERPEFRPSKTAPVPPSQSALKVAVLSLGVRRSLVQQLSSCSAVEIFPPDAAVQDIMAARPAGVLISDGPGTCLPPMKAVDTIKELIGRAPLLGCGLGHVALGMALECAPTFLKRGHHGANYPVRNVLTGKVEVTQQRHTVALDRRSLEGKPGVEVLSENVNDGTVEGFRATGLSAVGFQQILVAPQAGLVNAHLKAFVDGLLGK